MKILVTGSAGFIGFHVAKKLLARGDEVIGIDNFNDYYDPKLKEARNKILKFYKNYRLYRLDFSDFKKLEKVFKKEKINKICHLGAQAGVRHSITNPFLYEKTNIVGTLNLLELAKINKIKDFIFASSSSVYGNNQHVPFAEQDTTDQPISFYAVTKKTAELMAYTYHSLYGINCAGLRFFTVYGPYGRPDMAYFQFVKAILENKAIKVYNNGCHQRDFTYIDDVISGILKAIDHCPKFEIINLGNNQSITVNKFIAVIEKELCIKAKKVFLPQQAGDVDKTFASIVKAKKILKYRPQTKISQGMKEFINWYKTYYHYS